MNFLTLNLQYKYIIPNFVHSQHLCLLVDCRNSKENNVIHQTLEDTTSIAIASCVDDTRRLWYYLNSMAIYNFIAMNTRVILRSIEQELKIEG